MTPFSHLARRLSTGLEEMGFGPLDVWDDGIGGDRHGVLDHTWISSHSDGRHEYATLYVWPTLIPEHGYIVEVWAALENGRESPRSLVLQTALRTQRPSAADVRRLQGALLEAANRARKMRLAEVPETERDLSTSELAIPERRAPYRDTVGAVARVIHDDPEREWRNRDVLAALRAAAFPTDRAAVNAALAELAWRGEIYRVRRGWYRALD